VRVLIGTCGFAVGRKKYYESFDAVELQQTFYNPPEPSKLTQLKNEAPAGFIFTMKAWQAITHPPSMRTWRRSKVSIPKDRWDRYGFLKPTEENFKAWEIIMEGVKALNAFLLVVQLPPSFGCSDENYSNMRDFFMSIEDPRIWVGLELRGTWRECGDRLRSLIDEFDFLVHVTDPFRWMPVVFKEVTYFRLHGRGEREVNYKYRYTDEDLAELRRVIEDVGEKGSRMAFFMFNNIYMGEDASRFRSMLLEDR